MKNCPINMGLLDMFRIIGVIACVGISNTCFSDTILDQDLTSPPRSGMEWRSSKPEVPTTSSVVIQNLSPLSLAELTDLALRNNPTTREAWEAAHVQAAAVGIANSGYFPSVNLNIPLTRGKTSINSSSGIVSGTAQTRLSPNISLGYVLYDFGARAAANEASSFNLLAANLTQNRTLQTVMLRVEQTYYQLLGARQTIVAGEEILKNIQMSLDVANARRQAGLATIGDVFQAETLLAQSRLQLRKAQGEANKLKGALCNAVGLPVNSKLNLAPMEVQMPTKAVHITIDTYLKKAKVTRPDLGAAEAQSRAAHANVNLAVAQGDPSLNLSISGGKTYNNFQSSGLTSNSVNGTVGISLNVPLFNGFLTTNTVRQAQALANQMDATRDRVSQQVDLDVWEAYFDLDTAEVAIDSAHALLRSAGQAREVAQARYQAGVGNMPDLLLAQANEANAHMEVIQAEMGWYSSLSQLNNAIGIFSSDLESK